MICWMEIPLQPCDLDPDEGLSETRLEGRHGMSRSCPRVVADARTRCEMVVNQAPAANRSPSGSLDSRLRGVPAADFVQRDR